MSRIAGAVTSLLFYGRALSVCAVAISGLPGMAPAETLSSNTQQLLPLGTNTCPPIVATNFTPYVYDNALNSFEFTVSDPSNVAIVGSVGGTSIPLHFMTRRLESGGAVRINVDVQSSDVRGVLRIRVTFLSTHGAGTPLCISVVSTSIASDVPSIVAPAVAQKPPVAPPVPEPVPVPSVPTISTTTDSGAGSSSV